MGTSCNQYSGNGSGWQWRGLTLLPFVALDEVAGGGDREGVF